ncbi:tumor necrosis factor receptor superfamily member 9a [Carcharodon carcharias]|uniref:tumor necrosis factor receptor superfamily member 9a n=1 Tax=Carcharodon carcharias TaxID=13397 RepID=UPI001B7EA306|nr:tumor necrosis factor receptor superfamily member 9a [Carcharodon carcharias]
MLCFKRKSTITVFLILILGDLIKATSGPSKLTSEFKHQVSLQKCPPGKYKVLSYPSKNQMKCAPCEEGTYTEKENSLTECRKCYGRCTGNSVQTVPCTSTTNRKCECAPHHYCTTEDPIKCEQCKKCGDKKQNFPDKEDYYKQACRPCPPGTFLNTTQSLGCQPHTNCTDKGKILHTKGNSTADNHCVDSPSSKNGGNVSCIPTTDKKCQCPLGHYCAICGDGKKIPSDQGSYQSQVCESCPPGTFLTITQKCQPYANCTQLGMTLKAEGNSTVDNDCVGPPKSLNRKGNSSTLSMIWIVFPLSILCVIIIVRSSLCRISNKQGIGMLVKLKFICICGIKSDLYKGGDNEPEIDAATVPEIGELCADSIIPESKPSAVMVPLISIKKTEAPTLKYNSEILDIETVSAVVHPKDNAEDNIPFPVQENGRNSKTYYPIEEQCQKQYNQSVTMEAKGGTPTSLYLDSNKYQLHCISV